jgi:hypothetical protein
MRIDGPRNLEPTAELSGSFSGSFLGKFTNRVADAQLSGSFSGSFFGRASGSFSGSFAGNGAQLDNVFKRIVAAPNDVTSILDAQNTGAIIFTSESGAGLRITQHQVAQSAPEIVFNLVDIPNSSLANSTISGIELGQNLESLDLGSGIKFVDQPYGTVYNGSVQRELQLDPDGLSALAGSSLAISDSLIVGDSNGIVRKLTVSDFVDTLNGSGISANNGQLSLNSDQLFSTVLNSSGLTVGATANTNIEFSEAGSTGTITIRGGGTTALTIIAGSGTNTISIGSGVDFDGLGDTNIKDMKSVTANSSSFQTIQGKWRGVPGTDNSQVANWTRGVPMCFTAERSNNVQVNKVFAFGNGGEGEGAVMPFDGRILAVTLGYSGPLKDSSNNTINDIRFRPTINGSVVGTENAAGGAIIIDDNQSDGHGGSVDVTSKGSQVVTGITDLATHFTAGDAINWQCTSISTATSTFTGEVEAVLTLAFWVIFD